MGTKPEKSRWFWGFVIAVLLFLQWPSIKEVYYRVSGTEFPESTIPWKHDMIAAAQDASSESKPILAVFGASWCPPCRAMKRQVWPDAEVSRLVESQYVPLYVDVDDHSQSAVVDRYQIHGIPAVLILDSEGRVLRQGYSMTKAETLEFLQSALPAP